MLKRGGRIRTGCVGPVDVDPDRLGQAFPRDPLSCIVMVENVAPMGESLCLTSVMNVILGEGEACEGGECTCVAGETPGQLCVTQEDCLPQLGSDRGLCASRATANLLPAGAFRCAVTGDSTMEGRACDPTGSSGCGEGVCCVLLDAEDAILSISHAERVRVSDTRPLFVETMATGVVLGSGRPFSLRFQAPVDVEDLHCGDRIASPCRVTIEKDPQGRVFCEAPGSGCTEVVQGAEDETALQRAINLAPDGAPSLPSIISVRGRCHGPVRVYKRANMTIRGILPGGSVACQDGNAPLPEDLRSTVAGRCNRSEGDCETLKIYKSSNIRVEYLNIVNGMHSGLEFRRSTNGMAFCNCMARNLEEGLEFDKGNGHVALQNLVTQNGALEDGGIRVHDSVRNVLRKNIIVDNKTGGINFDDEANENLLEENVVRASIGYGIRLVDSEDNRITNNLVETSTKDGIYLKESEENTLSGNVLVSNLFNAIRLKNADENVVYGNTFTSNGADTVVCERGSHDNTGSDVAGNADCE